MTIQQRRQERIARVQADRDRLYAEAGNERTLIVQAREVEIVFLNRLTELENIIRTYEEADANAVIVKADKECNRINEDLIELWRKYGKVC